MPVDEQGDPFGFIDELVRDQVRLYAAQSALISVLAVVIAADRGLPALYALAGLFAALKVVAVPLVLRRLLGAPASDDTPGIAGSYTLSPASAVLAVSVRMPSSVAVWPPFSPMEK